MDFNNSHQQIEIQVQNRSGYWQTTRTVPFGNSQYIIRQMEFVKHAYPQSRVRAITADGQLVDMLP